MQYKYNGANELVRENNGFTNQTVTYAYDLWGNITEKNVYAYTTVEEPTDPIDTKIYGYSTGEWKDQLLTFGAETIGYDAMGNPLTYRGKKLSWHGKQLTTVKAGDDTVIAAYVYDSNGLRQKKTVSGTDTNYYYNGSVLIGLTRGDKTLRFSYDASGQVSMVEYEKPNETAQYYYLRNGQGDIVKLIDGSGNAVVEYTYDSWGKPLSCTGTLATSLGALNPFRYRGYVYDEETQWYYLKSRYYDPETCRFISADVILSTGQGVIGHNSYAYCLNNPASMVDDGGNSPFGILEWLDYALIHLMVQVQCAIENGWFMEVYVSGPKGRGFLDLYDSSEREYYEVKSEGSANSSRTTRQMNKYDVAIVGDTYGNRLILSDGPFGNSITRGKKKVKGSFQYGIYDINYELKENGLIQYFTTRNKARLEKCVTVGVAVVVLVVVATLLPEALPTLAFAA